MEKLFKSKGEYFLEEFSGLYRQSLELKQESFLAPQLTGLLATMGILIERFFGETVLPDFYEKHKKTRKNKEGFLSSSIRQLYEEDKLTGKVLTQKISKKSADSLHDIRRKYNEQKHDPAKQISLNELITISWNAMEALHEVVNTNLGNIGVKVFQNSSTFWIGGTDYAHQGITEVFLCLPVDVIGQPDVLLPDPPILFTFFLKMDGWDTFIKTLSHTGQLYFASEIIPKNACEKINFGSDPLAPRIYVGSIEPLLLSLNQLRNKLVSDPLYNVHDLKFRLAPLTVLLLVLNNVRAELGDNTTIISNQVVANTTNVLEELNLPFQLEQLTKEVEEAITLFKELPKIALAKLSGPVWVDDDSFNRLAKIRDIRSGDGNLAISSDMQILINSSLFMN